MTCMIVFRDMNGNDSRFATGHRGESPSVSKQKHTETETNSKLPPGERWIMAVRHIAACQRNCETNKDLYNEKSVSQSPLTCAFASICQFVISEQKKIWWFVLCWAPAPFFYCFAAVFLGETQIWLGDLRVVWVLFPFAVFFVGDYLPLS